MENPSNLEVIVEIKPECLTEQGLRAENIIELFARHGFHPYSLHNDYSPTSYLDRREIARPARIRTPIVSQTDVLVSRKEADHL